ncbi:MAG: amino acid permease, partial [Bryobacteraceae bacterium]
GPSIWIMVAASFVAMTWSGAIPVVTSLSTVALYIAYAIPIVLAYRARRAGSDWPSKAPWSLGRYGGAFNVVAIVYSALICVLLVMPPNELAGKTLLGLTAALVALYLSVARRKYRGPEWSRTHYTSAAETRPTE